MGLDAVNRAIPVTRRPLQLTGVGNPPKKRGTCAECGVRCRLVRDGRGSRVVWIHDSAEISHVPVPTDVAAA